MILYGKQIKLEEYLLPFSSECFLIPVSCLKVNGKVISVLF